MPDYSKNFLTSMTGFTPLDIEGDPEPKHPTDFKKGDFEFKGGVNRVSLDSLRKKSPTDFKTGDFEFKGGVNQAPAESLRNQNAVDFKTGDFEFKGGANKVPLSQLKKGDPLNFNTGDFEFKGGIKQTQKAASGDPAKSKIPLPDYNDPAARLKYAETFNNTYGKDILKGFGDIPLRVNEKPVWGSDTSKNLATKYASKLGLSPALFYASSMIEGQSGYYEQKDKKTGKMMVNSTGDKDYPVSAMWGFGLDSFEDYLPSLKKKGYLPQDFDKNFKVFEGKKGEGGPLGKDYPDESVMFKTTDAGIQAKAAMMKAFYDELDDYSKKKDIKLTPEQRDFFSLAHFNSGSHGYEMLDAYNKAGLLKDNKFMEKMPNIDIPAFNALYKGDKTRSAKLHKQIYSNVVPRLAAAKGLKEQGLIEN